MFKFSKMTVCTFVAFNLFFTSSFAYSPNVIEVKEHKVEESVELVGTQKKI